MKLEGPVNEGQMKRKWGAWVKVGRREHGLWKKEEEGVSLREKEAMMEGMESVKNKKMLAVGTQGSGFIVTRDGWHNDGEGEEGLPGGF